MLACLSSRGQSQLRIAPATASAEFPLIRLRSGRIGPRVSFHSAARTSAAEVSRPVRSSSAGNSVRHLHAHAAYAGRHASAHLKRGRAGALVASSSTDHFVCSIEGCAMEPKSVGRAYVSEPQLKANTAGRSEPHVRSAKLQPKCATAMYRDNRKTL
eukprot:2130087-Pleurochrysis_carterae.AAC.3